MTDALRISELWTNIQTIGMAGSHKFELPYQSSLREHRSDIIIIFLFF